MMMRALGPGSVSSFLKVILDVVYAALIVGLGAVGLLLIAALVFSFDPGLLRGMTLSAGGASLASRWPAVTGGLLAAGLYIAGVLVIVGCLRRIFATLTAGDPFHPDNVSRLRLIGAMLAALELGRYGVWAVGAWLMPEVAKARPGLSLTAWFSVLVVFVLAEVFREGARLRREAELTI
ncbi:MAG TPA: DUF2975 domain-containing protein [Phenylobacterium sp.]|nr:DUF2975 domain-containing protein [Phenylobacterium sp.]HSV02304.1 DUF2975 domain-containing protein [Phenylobacterium sp.]